MVVSLLVLASLSAHAADMDPASTLAALHNLALAADFAARGPGASIGDDVGNAAFLANALDATCGGDPACVAEAAPVAKALVAQSFPVGSDPLVDTEQLVASAAKTGAISGALGDLLTGLLDEVAAGQLDDAGVSARLDGELASGAWKGADADTLAIVDAVAHASATFWGAEGGVAARPTGGSSAVDAVATAITYITGALSGDSFLMSIAPAVGAFASDWFGKGMIAMGGDGGFIDPATLTTPVTFEETVLVDGVPLVVWGTVDAAGGQLVISGLDGELLSDGPVDTDEGHYAGRPIVLTRPLGRPHVESAAAPLGEDCPVIIPQLWTPRADPKVDGGETIIVPVWSAAGMLAFEFTFETGAP